MKIVELRKPQTPDWLGRWVCSFCGTVIELDKSDVRRKVDYRDPVLFGLHCPGCNFVDQKWQRPVSDE